MEVPGMDEVNKKSQLISAAAFVEGGIQDACDDSCSICLEAFSDSDPCTVTSCKHEFHLQCILEWCQRSSNCPMCWQSISLKDPASQELLEAVEQERSFRFNMARNSTIFHHPTLGDFELQHLPVGVNDAELQDRIIHHLAAAAAMGRTHHNGRRESSRSRSANARPQFLVFSTNPNLSSAGTISSSNPVRGEAQSATITALEEGQHIQTSRPAVFPNRPGRSVDTSLSGQSSLPNQDRAGPSEFQSFSDSWKSRFNAISLRYKESISKSTRDWKEKLFSRSTSMADIGSEVRREVNAGIANVSRMMDRLETRESNRRDCASSTTNAGDTSAPAERNHETKLNDNDTASVGASSASN